MLQPTVRRTWAPRGQTPILESYDRHGRITAISAVTVSPRRRRLGLVFDLLDHNLAAEDFELFVDRLLVKHPDRLAFEWLPPYSPDLNPTEHVWGRTKYSRLANFIPDDLLHLGRTVSEALRKTRCGQRLLRSFFRQAEIDLQILETTIQSSIGHHLRLPAGKMLEKRLVKLLICHDDCSTPTDREKTCYSFLPGVRLVTEAAGAGFAPLLWPK